MARTTKRPPSGLGSRRQPGLSGQRVPLAPPDPVLRQRAWAVFTIGLLSVLSLFFLGNLQRGVYVVGVALAFGLLATCLGALVVRAARRGGMARPRGAVAGLVFGVLGTVLSTVCLVAFAMFWTQLTDYQSCMTSANTVAAQQACQNQFSNSVSNQISQLESGH